MPVAGAPYATLSNGFLRVSIQQILVEGQPQYYLALVELNSGEAWQPLLYGTPGREFVTSTSCINATGCRIHQTPDGESQLILEGRADKFAAQEVITLAVGQPFLQRTQTYRFHEALVGNLTPGFRLPASADLRYTYPLLAHEQPLTGLPYIRQPADWAVPFPFHTWHTPQWVGLYGLDKRVSPGTLEFAPPGVEDEAELCVYYPDTARSPEVIEISAGQSISLTEIVGAQLLVEGAEPLLEAERLAATILLSRPPLADETAAAQVCSVAQGIAHYFQHCGLWEPEALGPGRGWFSNMWVRTQTGPAKKRGEYAGFYDLGWGEGVAVETWLGIVRYWRRTGKTDLLPYVDEMTSSLDLFKRRPATDELSSCAAPYFDRSDGQNFGDFLMGDLPGQRIWTHSLGHTGSQLLQLAAQAPNYPNPAARRAWLSAAASIANFLAQQQQANGDLLDIFDEQDRECNHKPHRITARAVVCGLWARMFDLTSDLIWIERALSLAEAIAPEIERYEYYNQMIDTYAQPELEAVDGEAAYYVLEGLVPLYAQTRNPHILALCKKAVAFATAWTYFYNLPYAHQGIARGGQCCRDDIPLLYPVGPAKGIGPLLELAQATGDRFYEKLAHEAGLFIAQWALHAPGQPWDGAILHAIQQYSGKHWGPDLAGQVDTGVAVGNGLAALEAWLNYFNKQNYYSATTEKTT